MESIGDRLIWYYVPFTNIEIPGGGINVLTVFNSLVVMVFLWTLMWFAVRRMTKIPGRSQVLIEQFVTAFDGLVSSSLELPSRRENRAFLKLAS